MTSPKNLKRILWVMGIVALYAFYWSVVHVRAPLFTKLKDRLLGRDINDSSNVCRDVQDALDIKIREIGVRVADLLSKHSISEAKHIIETELTPAQKAYEEAKKNICPVPVTQLPSSSSTSALTIPSKPVPVATILAPVQPQIDPEVHRRELEASQSIKQIGNRTFAVQLAKTGKWFNIDFPLINHLSIDLKSSCQECRFMLSTAGVVRYSETGMIWGYAQGASIYTRTADANDPCNNPNVCYFVDDSFKDTVSLRIPDDGPEKMVVNISWSWQWSDYRYPPAVLQWFNLKLQRVGIAPPLTSKVELTTQQSTDLKLTEAEQINRVWMRRIMAQECDPSGSKVPCVAKSEVAEVVRACRQSPNGRWCREHPSEWRP